MRRASRLRTMTSSVKPGTGRARNFVISRKFRVAPFTDIATERLDNTCQPVAEVVHAELGRARGPAEDCRAVVVDGAVIDFEFAADGGQCLDGTRHVVWIEEENFSLEAVQGHAKIRSHRLDRR